MPFWRMLILSGPSSEPGSVRRPKPTRGRGGYESVLDPLIAAMSPAAVAFPALAKNAQPPARAIEPSAAPRGAPTRGFCGCTSTSLRSPRCTSRTSAARSRRSRLFPATRSPTCGCRGRAHGQPPDRGAFRAQPVRQALLRRRQRRGSGARHQHQRPGAAQVLRQPSCASTSEACRKLTADAGRRCASAAGVGRMSSFQHLGDEFAWRPRS